MSELHYYQYLLIGLIFIWSGFVRSGLGFGGAVLSLPFLLLVHNQPLVFLPLISVQLLFFSSITLVLNNRKSESAKRTHKSTVGWAYLRYMLAIMIVPKLLGVFGLITMLANVLSIIIFVVVSVYAITYIANKPFKSNSKFVDATLVQLALQHAQYVVLPNRRG